jgi:hypothetical protein
MAVSKLGATVGSKVVTPPHSSKQVTVAAMLRRPLRLVLSTAPTDSQERGLQQGTTSLVGTITVARKLNRLLSVAMAFQSKAVAQVGMGPTLE